MSIEGRLEIILQKGGGGIEKALINSSRPLQIASFFYGKNPEEVLTLIPSLFSICGIAQTYAAVAACEQAVGVEISLETHHARQIAVWAETAREHITRIALDWGKPVGSTAIKEIIPLAQRVKQSVGPAFALGGEAAIDRAALETQIENLQSYLEKDIFGEPLEAWRQRQDIKNLEVWVREKETQAACLLKQVIKQDWQGAGNSGELQGVPELKPEPLFDCLDNRAFIAQPTWNDVPKETTALTRSSDNLLIQSLMNQYGLGLLTRLTGLLVELANIPIRMQGLLDGEGEPQTAPTKPNRGLAQIEAARGRLIHGVRLTDGLISGYRILAPTEWNFHPKGCAAQALENISSADDETIVQQAKLVICAIDPCVAFDVRIA